MKKNKRLISGVLAVMMSLAMGITGCGKEEVPVSTDTPDTESTSSVESSVAESETPEVTVPADDNYIELTLNVYYNDGDNSYFANEHGKSIIVTEDGQYTVSFDCATDLSSDARSAGVTSLTNLTAIYIKDQGASDGKQSPLKACDILYNSVVVDGTELTVTQTEAKSAFKSSGVFDTNDPINAWDGSCVAEVDATTDHVANFTTVDKPTTVSVTFTLSNMKWTDEPVEDTPSAGEVSANTYKNTAVFSTMDFTSMNALELTTYLGNGVNLGNTMEATYSSKNQAVVYYETGWGQPVTTAEMIQGMKDCGFDTVRIPVAWTSVMDYLNGDYEINEDFMARVEEIVNYALDAEMFVVLNDHWDYGWWAMFGSDKQEDVDMAWKVYEEMWTQIATRFKDYSDMLIFESANEELGNNLNNNSSWASSGHLSDDELYTVSNAINQKFVDIVRKSGGNNDDRFLLIAGINTNIANTCDARFKMPSDSAKGKLFVSVHYYDPWGYCGDNDTGIYSKWGVKKDFAYMDETVAEMKKFTDAGYGVIIGEWGALPVYDTKTGNSYMKDNTEVYTEYFLDVCALNNFCPVLWSTNNTYLKRQRTMISDRMTEIFTSHCYAEEVAAGDAFFATIKADMAAIVEAAPEKFENGGETFGSDELVSYIMWNGGAGSYNVGDVYTPDDCPSSIIPHDVLVDGAGTYTVSLDFPMGNSGLTFGALALNAGETTYPGCIMNITSVVVTDAAGTESELKLLKLCYTSSDDKKCTRVNLINSWVNKLPDDARNKQKLLGEAAGPVILDATQLVDIYSISITFELIIP